MSAPTALLTRVDGDVRINLLPVEYLERRRQRQLGWMTAAALVVVVLVLTGLYWLKRQDVEAARAERDDARAEVTRLEDRVAELRPFAELAMALDTGNELLASAMSPQVSWSRNLNDLAVRLPRDSSLRTLTAGVVGADPAAAGATEESTTTEETTTEEATTAAPPGAADDEALGTVNFTGYSTSRYAPGVQSVLTDLEKVRGYTDVYLSTAAKELAEATTVHNFAVDATLTDEALSGRFDDGLPVEEQ
ncbi:MAG: hypothetical protein KY434_07710 [Actinobacteria bacterium]|nr:hypothetical protein [Actinomycetota bacterium]